MVKTIVFDAVDASLVKNTIGEYELHLRGLTHGDVKSIKQQLSGDKVVFSSDLNEEEDEV